MSTPFAVTVFYLLTVTNNAGQLAPITNAELPAPFTSPMSWSEGQCIIMRGKMAQPEKSVCQVFRSAPSTSWTYVPPGSVIPSEVSPGPVEPAPQAKPEVPSPPERKSSLTPKGESEAEPLPPKPGATDTPKETPKPKRVAQRHDRQAMFEGNPFCTLFNW
jgi:hypothetical protein